VPPASAAIEIGLAEFCHAQHRRVVGLLSLYVGDAALAEELAQDVFVKVIANWHAVAPMERPEAWVRRVAINAANSWFRRRAAGRRAHERHDNRADVRAVAHADPDVSDAVAVRTAIAALPPRQKTAVILRYFADLSVADVAAEMGCTEGTVKTLTSVAIDHLRRAGLDVTE
jgi:RNA polymerase sigma factor (sigma-70 family)